jgi:transcriptional regulator with XRE-family HTH domain
MAEEFEEIVEEEVKEEIDYVSLGKAMRQIRTAAGMKQEEAAEIFHVSRTVYTKYETGTVKPSQEGLEAFAKRFNVSFEELLKKVSIAIPDTCALLKNKRLVHMLLEDYDQVVIPSTVMMELSYRKAIKDTPQDRKTSKVAWQVLASIDSYIQDNPDRIRREDNDGYKIPESVPDVRNMINDYKVMALAKDLEKKVVGDVIIIHDDVDFSLYDGKAMKIDDYVAKRSKLIDYTSIIDLDLEFNHLEYYKKIVSTLDLNAYLPDGMTLLISTIKCNDPEKIAERDGKRIPDQKVLNKVKFLLENGADPNINDNGRYCLPPLAHSIQTKEYYGFDIFKLLLDVGCDFNKAARDERTASYMKVGKLNEGNTPLMIACYHGKKKFVKILCEKEGISLNQQDSNGYTALIKCAVQRYNRKKRELDTTVNEELYRYLIGRGADTLIRDRNNHTADDWMKRGDNFKYKENEIW